LLQRLTNWRNPRNLTRIHLAGLARRRGFSIGDHTYGRPKVRFANSGRKLTIGAYCSIADGVEIMLGGNHRTEWVATFPFGSFPDVWPGEGIAYVPGTRGDVTIGNDVWVGTEAMIFDGVTIGDGAVVAARSVVTRDVRPYAIVGGNPARELRRRFDDDQVDALLALRWWEWPDDVVRARVAELCSADVVAFLGRHR
jgi:acetyltransferase-like isoleucine patch superfamily enzyme